jgi:hypothetical protein
MTMTATTTTAPTAEEILEVLHRLAPAIPAPEAAAIHLATPVDVTVGNGVWRENGLWRYRLEAVPMVGPSSLQRIAENAAWLAAMGARPADEYLNLAAGPGAWVKIISSGSQQIAFGLALFGAPALVADRGVPESVIRSTSEAAISRTISPPSVLVDGELTMLLSGDAERWHLVNPEAAL